MGPVPETWQMFIDGRFDQLAELKKGWCATGDNPQRGEPIDPECLHVAKIFVYAFILGTNRRPFIYPTPEGGIEVAWDSLEDPQRFSLECEFKPRVQVTY